MSTHVEAEAPGKVLWLGGYSVLEGNDGFVTVVDSKVHVSADTIQGNALVIDAPMLDREIAGRIEHDGMVTISTVPELTLLVKSIEMALMYYVALGNRATGLRIKTQNDALISYKIVNTESGKKVVKSGLGSSAALAVATVSAILKLLGIYDKEKAHKIAQLSHSIATGRIGSGFDIAAATFGNIIYNRYSPHIINDFPKEYTPKDVKRYADMEWDYRIKHIMFPKAFIPVFAHFKMESTITTSMVQGVNRFKGKNPGRYQEIIKEIKVNDDAAIEALIGLEKGIDERKNIKLFGNAFEAGRRATKMLGEESNIPIEPDDCTTLIEESKRHGALVAKLPGSGGKDSIAALVLSEKEAENLKKFWSSTDILEVLNLKISNEGIGFIA